jgi:hypothetical protein
MDSILANDLGLVETVDGLGQGIVIRIAARSDRSDGAFIGEALRITNRQVLHLRSEW